MATATFYIENNSTYQFSQSSNFKSWTKNDNGITYGYTTPSAVTHNKTFPTASIPVGSTINSALLYATVDKGTYGGTARQAGTTTLSGADIKAAITPGYDVSVAYYWKSNTGGSYPPTPGIGVTVYLDKTGTALWTALRLDVDYTPPYATKVWNGSSWISGTPHVWNGSAWVPGTAYVWNGSAWVPGLI